MILEKYERNPILKPNHQNNWESLSVCNPGIWYDDGIFYMLYRAAGDDEEHIIRFGLAISRDGINFERISNNPVFSPSDDGPDSGSIEDPRIVKFGEEYYVTYAYRPYPPGCYWTFNYEEVRLPNVSNNAPVAYRNNITNSGLALTTDFKSWHRLGRISQSNLDDRDSILFPEKINGQYVLLHRPKEWIGPEYGCEYPSIWITFSNDLMVWNEVSHLLIKGRKGTWEEKVGGSAPPLRTEDGWLLLYHGVDQGGKGFYRVGAVLLDLVNPTKIIARSKDWIMEPEKYYEMEGFYEGCVFPTGNVIVNDTLYIYYGGADKYVCVATCSIKKILDYLKDFKVD